VPEMRIIIRGVVCDSPAPGACLRGSSEMRAQGM
jgi:hypothetical protein